MLQGVKINKRISYYICPIEGADRIFIELLVKVGSNQDGDLKGMAHFFEHMLLAFDREMKDVKDYYDCIWGNTSFDSTSYKIQVNDGQDNNIKKCLETLRDIIMGKTLKEDFFGMVFNDILEEFNKFSTNKKAISLLCNLSDEKVDFPIGEKESLYLLNYEILLKFFKRYYTESPIALVITGNIENKKIVQLVKEVFSSIDFKKNLSSIMLPSVKTKKFCFYKNKKEILFLLKRDFKDYTLKKRVIDDMSFIICEEIIEKVYFVKTLKKCEINFKRILYDAERQYIYIEIKEIDNSEQVFDEKEWNEVANECIEQIKNIVSKEFFKKVKKEYILKIEKSELVTCEQYISEAKNNFLHGMEIFQKIQYLNDARLVEYKIVYSEIEKLIKDFSYAAISS